MTESPLPLFEEIVRVSPPGDPHGDLSVLLDTACVIGGSIAGLLAARVLSDHARRVVVIEADEPLAPGGSRPGVPQDQQVHTLLPAGHLWLERWAPGITEEAQSRGASLVGPDQAVTAFDGVRQAPDGAGHHLLAIGRPLLEALIRDRVTSLPHVSVVRGRATGLQYVDDAVSAVEYAPAAEGGRGDGSTEVLEADFVVDAMGRSSRLSSWLRASGYTEPQLERLEAPINYATALFERPVTLAELATAGALGLFSPEYPSGGVSVAAANAIEDQQWLVMLMGYGASRPGRTIEEFRAACAGLPGVFSEATAGALTRDVVTYHQAESRRRHFTQASHFPARLVSVGDAVASFNPIYGQGMSSAALHASCLALYLGGEPDLGTAARRFFELQGVVVDAAWAVSAGGDAARLDAEKGTEVPDDVRQQRWAMEQITAATLLDGEVTRAFNDVTYMLRHPATLADPAVLARAVAATSRRP
ncbi:NAD(P)/FAD-dependent oxidoreductase [Nocardioides sp. cx-173]|uniref:FAD-dependent oxidoreductase n=1 Tax=Nocardioides sp. cx-173 TaxID=2898796 RepID=UPI001E48DFC1|nr:FAD-dependent monooxygenase [Nocardioides sp. cx-173]MCD4525498.1 FAD-dependent monooxygenase [Nocardioides sp. cx-173]UGB42642.1 FAD-dependent monooxygenase [Nocardioides sp. cx-173]